LLKAIETQTEHTEAIQVSEKDEQTRGRKSHRKIEVFSPPPNIDPDWQKVKSVIKVTRSGEREGKEYSRVGYYICSLSPKSNRIEKAIRGHWEIENRLHWVKDVILDEDKSPQKAGKAPINFSIMKTWIMSVFRGHGFESIKGAIERFAHNLQSILSLLA